jgi:hypothetical protein
LSSSKSKTDQELEKALKTEESPRVLHTHEDENNGLIDEELKLADLENGAIPPPFKAKEPTFEKTEHKHDSNTLLAQEPSEQIVNNPSLFTKYGKYGTPHLVWVKLADHQKKVVWWDQKK